MRSSPAPAYSPDLASSDYHLFLSMQHVLADTHFSNYKEVQKCIIKRSMDCLKKQVVLSSRNPTFVKKMGKSHRKQRIIF